MRNYTHLKLSDRQQFSSYLEMNLSIKQISQRLGKHRSSIYRELKRNNISSNYSPYKAQDRAKNQRVLKSSSQLKIETNERLRCHIFLKLEEGWSPEQISGRLKRENSSDYVCHETIYRYIYRQQEKRLYYLLTHKRANRRSKYGRKPHTRPYLNRRSIHNRAQSIELRKIIGHWEGDTLQFSSLSRNITTLVERKTRFLFLIKNENKKTKTVVDGITKVIDQNSKKLWKSITFDRGSEFMNFIEIEKKICGNTYFCDPHSPWQRGSNENMNGRLRRFLPRKTDINSISQEDLISLQTKLNNTPRKCLGFKTPTEALSHNLKRVCRISS